MTDTTETDTGLLPDQEAKVFLSYSRKDREQAQSIADALRSRDFGVFRDTDDILPTEEWRDRLKQLIEEADTIVFLLSPASAASEVCAWEVEYANSLNKRIAPIVIDDVEGSAIPPLLARLNFIFCTPRDPFENAVDTLVSALHVDIDWIREHTRLNGLAARWRRAGDPAHLLLRGQDILDAERWRDHHPEEAPAVTQLQAEFIAASRADSVRRQRRLVGGALVFGAGALVLAVFAYFQSVEADRQRVIAEEQRGVAEENARIAEVERAGAEAQRAIVARRLAAQNLRIGDFGAAAELLRDVAADEFVTQTLLAGLATPSGAGKRDVAPTPYRLNGRLHLSQPGAAPIPLDLAFSATRWVRGADTIFLISENGQILEIDASGAPLRTLDGATRSLLCRAMDGQDGLTLISFGFGGYSAGSQRLYLTRIPDNGGPITRDVIPVQQDTVTLDGRDGPTDVDVIGVADGCSGLLLGSGELDPWFPLNDIAFDPPRFEEVRFPGLAGEDGLWQGPRDVELDSLEVLSWLTQFGFAATDLPRLLIRENGEPQGFVSDWAFSYVGGHGAVQIPFMYGGTGGEIHQVCLNKAADGMHCLELGGFGRLDMALGLSTEMLAVYGGSYSVENVRELGIGENRVGPYAVWLIDGDGTVYSTETTEPVLSAAFGLWDGRFAYLEDGALVLHDPDGTFRSRSPRPRGAQAVGWTSDDQLILFGDDGVHVGTDPDNLDFVPLAPPPIRLLTREDGSQYESFAPYWTAAEANGPVVALGYSNQVVLFDTEIMAPITGPFAVPYPYLGSTAILARGENGGWSIGFLGAVYERGGPDPARIGDAFDLQAVFD